VGTLGAKAVARRSLPGCRGRWRAADHGTSRTAPERQASTIEHTQDESVEKRA